jgi:hypothetical protein
MCTLQSCSVCCAQFPNLLGQALPTSSKFFFTYLIMRTLMSVPLRFLIAQPGVWQCWLRCGAVNRTQQGYVCNARKCITCYCSTCGMAALFGRVCAAHDGRLLLSCQVACM